MPMMDERCCGAGTCIIDPQGRCWCGQRWDGEKMCADALPPISGPIPSLTLLQRVEQEGSHANE